MLKNGKKVANVRDFLLENQDVRVIKLALQGFRVGGEVGREVALVELHPFHGFDFILERTPFFDGDDSILAATLLPGLGELGADFRVVVGGDGADLLDFLHVANGGRVFLEEFDDSGDGGFHAALELDGVGAGCDIAETFFVDGFSENCRGCCSVTGDVARLGRHLANKLGSDVLVTVFELDFTSHGNPVLGDEGGPEGFLDDDVATTGAEGDFDGGSQLAHTIADVFASFLVE